MKGILLLVVLAAGLPACKGSKAPPMEPAAPLDGPEEAEIAKADPAGAEAPAPGTLAARFRPRGRPLVEQAFLEPADAWRALEARITSLRAEASATREAMFVVFESGAFHATTRAGARLSWLLPEGLRLEASGRRLLIRADSTCAVYGPDDRKLPEQEELTVVVGTLQPPSGNVRKNRLVVKGGREFRSITSAG